MFAAFVIMPIIANALRKHFGKDGIGYRSRVLGSPFSDATYSHRNAEFTPATAALELQSFLTLKIMSKVPIPHR